MGFLSDMFNPAGSVKKYSQMGINEINQGKDQALGFYQPYVEQGQKGFTALSDLYGLNGADAQKTAGSMYQTSPGYQFQMDQGMNAINNNAALNGMRRSGATMKALNSYGQGVASQDYNKWLSGLQGLGTAGLTAAAGSGNTALYAGNAKANLWKGVGDATANQGIAQMNMLGNLAGKAMNFFGA